MADYNQASQDAFKNFKTQLRGKELELQNDTIFVYKVNNYDPKNFDIFNKLDTTFFLSLSFISAKNIIKVNKKNSIKSRNYENNASELSFSNYDMLEIIVIDAFEIEDAIYIATFQRDNFNDEVYFFNSTATDYFEIDREDESGETILTSKSENLFVQLTNYIFVSALNKNTKYIFNLESPYKDIQLTDKIDNIEFIFQQPTPIQNVIGTGVYNTDDKETIEKLDLYIKSNNFIPIPVSFINNNSNIDLYSEWFDPSKNIDIQRFINSEGLNHYIELIFGRGTVSRDVINCIQFSAGASDFYNRNFDGVQPRTSGVGVKDWDKDGNPLGIKASLFLIWLTNTNPQDFADFQLNKFLIKYQGSIVIIQRIKAIYSVLSNSIYSNFSYAGGYNAISSIVKPFSINIALHTFNKKYTEYLLFGSSEENFFAFTNSFLVSTYSSLFFDITTNDPIFKNLSFPTSLVNSDGTYVYENLNNNSLLENNNGIKIDNINTQIKDINIYKQKFNNLFFIPINKEKKWFEYIGFTNFNLSELLIFHVTDYLLPNKLMSVTYTKPDGSLDSVTMNTGDLSFEYYPNGSLKPQNLSEATWTSSPRDAFISFNGAENPVGENTILAINQNLLSTDKEKQLKEISASILHSNGTEAVIESISSFTKEITHPRNADGSNFPSLYIAAPNIPTFFGSFFGWAAMGRGDAGEINPTIPDAPNFFIGHFIIYPGSIFTDQVTSSFYIPYKFKYNWSFSYKLTTPTPNNNILPSIFNKNLLSRSFNAISEDNEYTWSLKNSQDNLNKINELQLLGLFGGKISIKINYKPRPLNEGETVPVTPESVEFKDLDIFDKTDDSVVYQNFVFNA